ncbi:MAG: pyridoxal-phosphate dependent enzyme, partial [Melioribacteraceae bacterium]|nr:pyridoxal-phosphate dependent enzyme [Melioribacteraceae bacterium]
MNFINKYSYICNRCNSQYSSKEIEDNLLYLCPKCGKAEKQRPLEGVLIVEYDYDNIKNNIKREDFLKIEPGKPWLYPQLWPIDFQKIEIQLLDRLVLPADNLLNYKINDRDILVFDETRNPTLSYKDRASSLVALKALELEISEISAASTGNAGSSLAGICARLGIRSHIFVPKNIPEAKRIQIEAYGADLVVVDGDYDLAFDTCLEVSLENNWYNRNTAYNPLTIEGKKSAAFDIFLQTQGDLPDTIIIPMGDGVIISGIFKGFSELLKLGWIEKLPQLIGVQSKSGDAIVRFLEEDKFQYKPANTIADSISAGAPRNLYMAAEAITQSNGRGISISDDDILFAQKEFIRETGIFCEPSSATAYAAYKHLVDDKIVRNKSVLLLITGNGLKDIN